MKNLSYNQLEGLVVAKDRKIQELSMVLDDCHETLTHVAALRLAMDTDPDLKEEIYSLMERLEKS